MASRARDSWYFTKEQLKEIPTIEDGTDYENLQTKKHNAFKFIERMREQLNFPQIIMNTAMVLYHRFFYYQSMKDFSWIEMAWCCLFTALKIEEKVMKMESLLKWSHHTMNLLQRKESRLDVNGKEYFERKERLQFNERILLQTIGFDCEIKKIGFMVTQIIPKLQSQNLIMRGVHKKLARVAFEWSHSSYGGEFCLLYEPELMATALIYGASKTLKYEIQHPSGSKWWDMWVKRTDSYELEYLLNDIMQDFYDYCLLFKEPRRAWVAPEPCTVKYIGKGSTEGTIVGVEFGRPFGTEGGENFKLWPRCRPKHGLLVPAEKILARSTDGSKNTQPSVVPLTSLSVDTKVLVVPPVPDGVMKPLNPLEYRPEGAPKEPIRSTDEGTVQLPVSGAHALDLAAPVVPSELSIAGSAAGGTNRARSASPEPKTLPDLDQLPDLAEDIFSTNTGSALVDDAATARTTFSGCARVKITAVTERTPIKENVEKRARIE